MVGYSALLVPRSKEEFGEVELDEGSQSEPSAGLVFDELVTGDAELVQGVHIGVEDAIGVEVPLLGVFGDQPGVLWIGA